MLSKNLVTLFQLFFVLIFICNNFVVISLPIKRDNDCPPWTCIGINGIETGNAVGGSGIQNTGYGSIIQNSGYGSVIGQNGATGANILVN
ncbi:857_t:CDS:2 [Ambispora gerdemannii]|uniref:857_t:CDS:1 n=1 Tax=Ambispora gerdemannii TaxID=144530 RepID=A0A9N9BUF7_9GLOM|nr:857_t:CDS:2 [Ambispora gerdemannii]